MIFVAPILGQGVPLTLNSTKKIGTIFSVFSYDAVLGRDSNLSRVDELSVTPQLLVGLKIN